MAFTKTEHVPRMMARMTLNLATQNKVLWELNDILGITESYPQPHQITCKPEQMMRFLATVSSAKFKGDERPSLFDLNIEYIDHKRDIIKTFVPHR